MREYKLRNALPQPGSSSSDDRASDSQSEGHGFKPLLVQIFGGHVYLSLHIFSSYIPSHLNTIIIR